MIHNRHDKLFKWALANTKVAKDFFSISLLADLKNYCDFYQHWLYPRRPMSMITYTLELERSEALLKVIKNIFIEEKYKETMQTTAQYFKQEDIRLGAYEAKCEGDQKMLAKNIDYLIVKEIRVLFGVELGAL